MNKCSHCGRYVGIPDGATHRDYKGVYWCKNNNEWFRFSSLTGEFHYRSRGRVNLLGMISL